MLRCCEAMNPLDYETPPDQPYRWDKRVLLIFALLGGGLFGMFGLRMVRMAPPPILATPAVKVSLPATLPTTSTANR